MPQPISYDSQRLDLTKRIQVTTTIAASPSGSSETVIGSLALTGFADTAILAGVRVSGWAALTVGTSGASVRLRIRRGTDTTGAVQADTGALTGGVAAGNLLAQDVEGFDTTGNANYVLTLTVGSGAAASTVSALVLQAVII